jgi:hypothetical protein
VEDTSMRTLPRSKVPVALLGNGFVMHGTDPVIERASIVAPVNPSVIV